MVNPPTQQVYIAQYAANLRRMKEYYGRHSDKIKEKRNARYRNNAYEKQQTKWLNDWSYLLFSRKEYTRKS